MHQHFAQLGLKTDIINYVRDCYLYKITKPITIRYSYLLLKDVSYEYLQYAIYVDLICPHAITDTSGHDCKLHVIAMIDPSTGQFEVAKIKNKLADYIGEILDYTQFFYY